MQQHREGTNKMNYIEESKNEGEQPQIEPSQAKPGQIDENKDETKRIEKSKLDKRA